MASYDNIIMTSWWAPWRLISPASRLLNRLFRRRSKKTSKLRITSFCAGNSPVTGAQMASNAENVSICWRHHVIGNSDQFPFQFDKQSIHLCLGLNISSAFHCLTDNNYHGTYTYSSANGARHRHPTLDCMYHGFLTIFSYQWLKCAFGAQTLLLMNHLLT